MSRQSYAYGRQSYAPYAGRMSLAPSNFRARDSVAPPIDYVGPLDDCVAAAERCLATIGKASNALAAGVEDAPRLNKVFRTAHHYLVIPEPQVHRRRAEYAASLEPQVASLISRSEVLLQREAETVERLEARVAELESTRAAYAKAEAAPVEEKSYLDGIDMRDKSITAHQRRKIGVMRNKRQQLLQEKARYMSV